jgi:FdhD protein
MTESPGSRQLEIVRIRDRESRSGYATIVVEEPLETRLNGQPIAVTMRTPGHDLELAMGFLVTETIVRDADAISTAVYCDENENVVDVSTVAGASVSTPEPRNFYASSSCGICGKASIDAVRLDVESLAGDGITVSSAVLATLPAALRKAQPLFEQTGAIHAAGLFSASGELVCAREDVGRHNAVDKIVGWAATRERLPLRGHILLVSGRAGFEIVQKAAVAGIPVIAAISGTSSLAVDLAEDCGLTLISFLRGSEMNVCSHAHRVEAAVR